MSIIRGLGLIGVGAAFGTAEVRADCPGRATLVSVYATARARIHDRTGQTCGSTGSCTDEKELVVPGAVTVQMVNVAGPGSAPQPSRST